MAITLNGSGTVTGITDLSLTNITASNNLTAANTVSGNNVVSSSQFTLRNKVRNGSMLIDQMNIGSVYAGHGRTLDGWWTSKLGSAVYSTQQVADAPIGLRASAKETVTTAASPAAGDTYQLFTGFEGHHMMDLAWGTANASPVTVSFWVKSSIAGTYGLSMYNSAAPRSCVTTYTINSANTWEYKTATFPGDTSGTWPTDNTVWGCLVFDLGSGSGQNTSTLNTWQAGYYRRTASCVNWTATNGATFNVTGVQLEKGTVATPFEHLPIDIQLLRCQRYFWVNPPILTFGQSSTTILAQVQFPVPMRATPSATAFSTTIYWENLVYSSIGSLTGVSFNTGHLSSSGGDLLISGTFSPAPTYSAMSKVDGRAFYLSAEI